MTISDFYTAIMNRLLTNITDVDGSSKIKFFDLWNNQTTPQDEEEELPFPTPAVFIEFHPSAMQTLGMRKQAGDVDFSLHIVSEVYAEHSSREEAAVRTNALDHLNLLDQIFYWLQNFDGDFFGAVDRTGFPQFDHNHTNLYEHLMPFKSRITDHAAMHPQIKVTPNPPPQITT